MAKKEAAEKDEELAEDDNYCREGGKEQGEATPHPERYAWITTIGDSGS